VFYVTTATEIVSIASHPGYGVAVDRGTVKELGPLPPSLIEVPYERPGPRFWGDGDPIGPDMTLTDPASIPAVFSARTSYSAGFGTPDTRQFGARTDHAYGWISNELRPTTRASDGKRIYSNAIGFHYANPGGKAVKR